VLKGIGDCTRQVIAGQVTDRLEMDRHATAVAGHVPWLPCGARRTTGIGCGELFELVRCAAQEALEGFKIVAGQALES
jgi:hypothetical protein